jgi:hypothetical protein
VANPLAFRQNAEVVPYQHLVDRRHRQPGLVQALQLVADPLDAQPPLAPQVENVCFQELIGLQRRRMVRTPAARA